MHTAPARQTLVIQRRGVSRHHDLAWHGLEQLQQLEMVRLLVVESVSASPSAGAPQVRRVAVDQLRALIVVLGQKPVGAPVNELNARVALELRERLCVAIDADVAQRRRLAFHDRAPTEMRLDVGVVGRHHGDEGLTQTRGRLRPKITHPPCSHRLYGSRTLAMGRYAVKTHSTTGASPGVDALAAMRS